MIPFVLVKHPNENRFMGSFDVENLVTWWLSEPLPGDVVEVVDIDWAYAQYQVCVCRMGGGTSSILRSSDYGITWAEVKNLAETIYTVTKVDYGWLVAATATGWYESTDSGLTWTKVSTQAPGCRTVIAINDHVLLAHSGVAVWKSTDYARNWRKVLDCRSIYARTYHTYYSGLVPDGFKTTAYSGSCYPALAGFGPDVLAAAGPYLLLSTNMGEEWGRCWGWENGQVSGLGAWSSQRIINLVHMDYIEDPEVPARTTRTASENVWMVQVYKPADGIVRNFVTADPQLDWTAKFDQPFIGADKGHIRSEVVLQPESTDLAKFAFCAHPVPRFSEDGGWTWTQINPSGFEVYVGDPSQSISTSVNPFLTDEHSAFSYQGPQCHNSGTWVFTEGLIRRGLSYDLDYFLQATKEATTANDMLLKMVVTSGVDLDHRLKKAFETSWTMDDFRKKAFDKAYLGHAYVQDTFEQGADHDMVLVHRYIWPWEMDILQQKALTLGWYNDILQQKALSDGFEMAMYLVEDRWDDVVNDIVKTMPQVWQVIPPDVPADVLDSRVQDFDDAGGA